MHRFVVCFAFVVWSLCDASTWKLVLKDGNTVECEGAPIVINDVYMFRGTDGKDGNLGADQVDQEKTARANKVDAAPRQWRLIGESDHETFGSISAVNDADFESEVLQSRSPVLVEFWATWCGFCKKMEPTIQSVAGDYSDRLKVLRLDIDKNHATAQRYGVRSVPTLLLFERGRVAATIHGAAGKSTVTQMLAGHL